MSETNTNLKQLPTIKATALLQPVSVMLANCLVATNPKLQQLDFSHLQMYIPPVGESADTFTGQVLVKQQSNTRYRLESRQQFTYTRIDADEGLNVLGFTEREFSKEQFDDVVDYLSNIGDLAIVDGDLDDENQDAIINFVFGKRNRDTINARFIDFSNTTFNKNDLELVFNGSVNITFKGKNSLPTTEDTNEDDGLIDITSFFLHRNLGGIFKAR